MTLQRTTHIAMAMQRHGGSAKPCVDSSSDKTAAYKIQKATAQRAEPQPPPAEPDEAAA